MEFWGVEVPSGKPIPCKPGPALYVHITQAAIGDSKNAKNNDRIILKVKVGTNEVVGTLSQGNCDQTALDLIFEKDFVLSHTGSGSVYFCGYKTDAARDEDMSLKTVARGGLNVLLGGLSAVSIVVILCLGVRRIKYGPA